MKIFTKHPNIAGSCEPAEVDALRRHPLDGQLALACLVVRVVVDPTRETKIRQFDAIV